jgi:hypothetical protein
MAMKQEPGTACDNDVPDVIARTLVTESAQAAGFGLALPFGGEFRDRLVVFAPVENPEVAMQARFVRVQWVGLDEGPVMLGPGLVPGELLALVDGADPETDTVLLLTQNQVKDTWEDYPGGWDAKEWTFGGWCRASPQRWRELVIVGSEVVE